MGHFTKYEVGSVGGASGDDYKDETLKGSLRKLTKSIEHQA